MFVKIGYHYQNYPRDGLSPATRKAGLVMSTESNGYRNVLNQQQEIKQTANIDSSFATATTVIFQQTLSSIALQTASFYYSYFHIAHI
jgi:hypothetical protein